MLRVPCSLVGIGLKTGLVSLICRLTGLDDQYVLRCLTLVTIAPSNLEYFLGGVLFNLK